ncbi:MAG: hypothetical protein IPL50_06120 [Chitinophagaceae bacterium]|nr:hypothetical protein [Chitinophagaceae bacterium]
MVAGYRQKEILVDSVARQEPLPHHGMTVFFFLPNLGICRFTWTYFSALLWIPFFGAVGLGLFMGFIILLPSTGVR